MIRKDSGFTLAELMVTIAVIATVASIAVPNFIGWLPKYRLGSAARDVMSAIEFTRLTAVRQYADAEIQFNVGNSSYTASVVGGEVFKSGNMPAGVSISGVTFSGTKLVFNNQGIPKDWGGGVGSVTLSSSTGTKVITVKLSGNARIQ